MSICINKVTTSHLVLFLLLFLVESNAFVNTHHGSFRHSTKIVQNNNHQHPPIFVPPIATTPSTAHKKSSPMVTKAVPADLDLNVVALVAGQENYGFAIVALGEAAWSFLQAPSFDHAKILVPAIISAAILVAVSGPMITSGDAYSVSLGLQIATVVSIGLGASYVARLVAPYSPSAKEIAFLGLLVAIAGFFSFSQNLVVDGFIQLPTLPSVPMPTLPSISLPF